MRIVAGIAKGTRLAPVPSGVRPLSDRAREGLFSSLGARCVGARVLDLFAGSGAVGIEALSREATSAVFVDRSHRSIEAVERNLRLTDLADLGETVRSDVASFLARPRPGAPFDIVVLDPPYSLGSDPLAGVLGRLAHGWLASEWIVVLTRGDEGSVPPLPLHWSAARRLRYGDSHLTLFQEV